MLPGVSVEASSPALIEKVRTAVTDNAGQYRIEDLRPGTYVVTFSLSGFGTVRREDIVLTGSFAAPVSVELKVGALAETITVSGETPVIDVVNARQQSILDNDTIAAIPTARLYHSLVALVPGVSLSGNQDVGGLAGPLTVTFAMRGGPGNEGRLTVDGLSLGASLNGTGVSYTVADVGNAQEVVFSTSGSLGEAENAGPAMNLVPRQGGNRFSGTFFANGANDSLQSDNFTDEVRAAGLRAPNALAKIWDMSAAIGGPIRRDRLWFFSATRYQGNHRLVGGMFRNRNEGNANAWLYVPDDESPGGRRQRLEERERPHHLAGVGAQQVQRLLGRAAELHAVHRRRRRDDRAGGARQQSVAAPRAAADVDLSGHAASPVRGGDSAPI